jgi:uncharacterized membrane protein YoaK (UPF0700 family)
MTLALAFSLRQIQFTASGSDQQSRLERIGRIFFIALVVAYVIAVSTGGQNVVTAALEGLTALGFVTYGTISYHEQTADSRLQGTMLDSLLRHLLPVLTFASLISIVALAIPFNLPRIVVLHIQVVFVIMTATALMTATIKLRQNLAGL